LCFLYMGEKHLSSFLHLPRIYIFYLNNVCIPGKLISYRRWIEQCAFSILLNNFKKLGIMSYNDYIFYKCNTIFIKLLFYKMEYYVTCDCVINKMIIWFIKWFKIKIFFNLNLRFSMVIISLINLSIFLFFFLALSLLNYVTVITV